MESTMQPDTTLLLRTPRNAKTLTVKIEDFKFEGDSITSFDILLYQHDSLLAVPKKTSNIMAIGGS